MVFRYDAERALACLQDAVLRPSKLELTSTAEKPEATLPIVGPEQTEENPEKPINSSVPAFLSPFPPVKPRYLESLKHEPQPMSRKKLAETRFDVSKNLKQVNETIEGFDIKSQVVNSLEAEQAKQLEAVQSDEMQPGESWPNLVSCKPKEMPQDVLEKVEARYFKGRCFFKRRGRKQNNKKRAGDVLVEERRRPTTKLRLRVGAALQRPMGSPARSSVVQGGNTFSRAASPSPDGSSVP